MFPYTSQIPPERLVKVLGPVNFFATNFTQMVRRRFGYSCSPYSPGGPVPHTNEGNTV